jgi:hypothetical protein
MEEKMTERARRLSRLTAAEKNPPPSGPISSCERADLRWIIKARSKVLKFGINEREADERAGVERQINARYAEQKALFDEADARARALVAEFNRTVLIPLYALVGDHPQWGGFRRSDHRQPARARFEICSSRGTT